MVKLKEEIANRTCALEGHIVRVKDYARLIINYCVIYN